MEKIDKDKLISFLIGSLVDGDVVLLEGSMGVGKTTLVVEICKKLGIEDQVASPTYSILNEYEGNGIKINHFDLYRIESKKDLIDLGIEDFPSPNAISFVEWPDRLDLAGLNRLHFVNIKISCLDDNSRSYEISYKND